MIDNSILMNATNTVPANVAEEMQDIVSKALLRAWQLGQTYLSQADSDSFIQHKKADETQAKFNTLVDETRAALAAPAQAVQPGYALVPVQQVGTECPACGALSEVAGCVCVDCYYSEQKTGELSTDYVQRFAHGQATLAPPQPADQDAPVDAAVQALIDSAPAPFRRLGELLASTLDEDQWEHAQSLLLGGLVAVQEGRDIQGDIDHYNENME